MPIRRNSALAGLAVLTFAAVGFGSHHQQKGTNVQLLEEVMTLVKADYVSPVSTDTMYDKAARGLVHELNDPYSVLYSPKELAGFNAMSSGHYAGVGMEVAGDKGEVVVQHVFPNTPAERARVMEGDKIISIDTASTRNMSVNDVSDRIKGDPGTHISITFTRAGVTMPIPVTFTRSVIKVPSVPYAMMLPGNIGYIPLLQFTETASDEVAAATKQLQAQGAKGLVLYFRGNPGGILEQALAVSNLFLHQGVQISSVRGRGQSETYTATDKPLAPTIPLVVLSDGGSASASEIVMGALQDHDRALVVGTTSFGKGLVQSVFQLDGGYALKLTTAKWYTPSGRSIQKERKLLANGDFVEVMPDSLETDSVRKSRPKFHSDAGRIVYGGGAITPDLIVQADTLTTPEQQLMRVLAPKGPIVQSVLESFAIEQKGKVSPDFTVPAAWHDEIFKRLIARGVPVQREQFQAGISAIDRLIGDNVARISYGDSAEHRRDMSEDTQLQRALSALREAKTQTDLFEAASREAQAGKNKPRA